MGWMDASINYPCSRARMYRGTPPLLPSRSHPRWTAPGGATPRTDLSPYRAPVLPSTYPGMQSPPGTPMGGDGWICGMSSLPTRTIAHQPPGQPAATPPPVTHRPIMPAAIGSLLVASYPLRMKERALHRQPVSATTFGHHLAPSPANEETRTPPAATQYVPVLDQGASRGPQSRPNLRRARVRSDQRPPSDARRGDCSSSPLAPRQLVNAFMPCWYEVRVCQFMHCRRPGTSRQPERAAAATRRPPMLDSLHVLPAAKAPSSTSVGLLQKESSGRSHMAPTPKTSDDPAAFVSGRTGIQTKLRQRKSDKRGRGAGRRPTKNRKGSPTNDIV